MKLNQVDARGRSCPEPVLMTKKAVDKYPEGVQVLVDNTTARENISRFAKNAGYQVDAKKVNGDYLISLIK